MVAISDGMKWLPFILWIMMWTTTTLTFRCSRFAARSPYVATLSTNNVVQLRALLRHQNVDGTKSHFVVNKRYLSNTVDGKRKADKKAKVKGSTDQVVGDLTNCETGIVIERLGDRLLVEYPLNIPFHQRSQAVCRQRAQFLQNQQHIVPGDYVHFRPLEVAANDSETLEGIVEGFYNRRNTLERPSASSTKKKITIKPIASNIDQLLVVVAVEPLVPLHTLDRYIVSAHVHKIPNVHFVVNKADLPETKDLYKRLSHYEKLGHRLIMASTLAPTTGSTTEKDGLQAVRELLRGKTSVVVGQSGVGKSSLINALIPSADLVVGDLVGNNMYGAHTTSNARLYHIPAPFDPPSQDLRPVDTEAVLHDEDRRSGNHEDDGGLDDHDGELVDDDNENDEVDEGNDDDEVTGTGARSKGVTLPTMNEDGSWGRIIDSPGIRELGIWHLDRRTIQNGFQEIMRHARNCKYRNCAHSIEDAKHCGVWKAMKEGHIHPARYAHFISIRDQHHE